MTRTYTFTRPFYEDSVFCECDGGTIIRETAKTVTVELTADAYNDLRSRAVYYDTFNGEDYAANRGLVLSARAMLKRLDANPFPADEIVAAVKRAAETWEAGREEREALQREFRRQLDEAEARLKAEAEAHPTTRATYSNPIGTVVGVEQDATIRPGARIRVYRMVEKEWVTYEVVSVEREARGDIYATVSIGSGDPTAVKVERS